jgi:two-component system, chemotaxis family, sensor kinase CheA
MFIDDEELRSLYEAASAEHITAIESGLLQLEKNPTDLSPLKALLREAHSLKGDSRMLDVLDAEAIVHQMEEILIAIESQQLAVTPELCDRLYQGLDAVDKIAQEAVTGRPAGLNLPAIIAAIGGAPVDGSSAIAVATPNFPAENSQEEGLAEIGDFGDLSFLQSHPALPNSEESAASELDFSSFQDLTELPPAPITDFGDLGDGFGLSFLQNDEEPGPPPAFDLSFLQSDEAAEPAPSLDLFLLADELDNVVLDDVPIQEPAIFQPAAAEPEAPEDFQIPTIKVEASRLERLTIQADELAVAKLRVSQRHEDLLDLYQVWEDWSRVLPANDPQVQKFNRMIGQMRLASAEDTARLSAVSNELESGIRQMRMLPLQTIFNIFPRMVRDLARNQQKSINFVIEGGEVLADKQILEALKDPLIHILRNAIDHGIEPIVNRGTKGATAQLTLRGIQRGNQIEIIVTDDGRGLDLQAIRQTAVRRGLYSETELEQMSTEQLQSLIFAAGFSTRTTVTELSGRGVGLDVVRTNIEKIKGAIRIESLPGQGCTFRILLNNSLATVDALILRVDNLPYAMPLEPIETMQFVDRKDIFTVDGKLTMNWHQQSVSVVWLADLLELDWQVSDSGVTLAKLRDKIPTVFIKIDGQYLGILVDELLEQQQIVVKAPNQLLKKISNISGASILGNGEICMVLDLLEIFQTASGRTLPSRRPLLVADRLPPHILLVEDSIPIRTQMKRILVGAGYEVTTAVDGAEGYQQLLTGNFNAVVSDVEMPNMSGLEMTSQIRELPQYQDLPIVLVTTLAQPEHRQRGLTAGANAYLSKGDFDQSLLLQTLNQLIKL